MQYSCWPEPWQIAIRYGRDAEESYVEFRDHDSDYGIMAYANSIESVPGLIERGSRLLAAKKAVRASEGKRHGKACAVNVSDLNTRKGDAGNA